VAEQLNNTRAVCRKYYVHPAVVESYLGGTMMERLQQNGTKAAAKDALTAEEQAVVRLLQYHMGNGGSTARRNGGT
jgi:DNA topoisomerase-1